MKCKCGRNITREDIEFYIDNCACENLDFDKQKGIYACDCDREYEFDFEVAIDYLFNEDELTLRKKY